MDEPAPRWRYRESVRHTPPEFSTRVSSGTMVGMLKTTIDLSAIAHNVRLIKEKVGPEVKLMCVVKACLLYTSDAADDAPRV